MKRLIGIVVSIMAFIGLTFAARADETVSLYNYWGSTTWTKFNSTEWWTPQLYAPGTYTMGINYTCGSVGATIRLNIGNRGLGTTRVQINSTDLYPQSSGFNDNVVTYTCNHIGLYQVYIIYSKTVPGDGHGQLASGYITEYTPNIQSLSSSVGAAGQTITINGVGFASNNTIGFYTPAGTLIKTVSAPFSNSSNTASFVVPNDIQGQNYMISFHNGSEASNRVPFSLTPESVGSITISKTLDTILNQCILRWQGPTPSYKMQKCPVVTGGTWVDCFDSLGRPVSSAGTENGIYYWYLFLDIGDGNMFFKLTAKDPIP